jgi:WD40 repeat protein
MTRCDIEHSGMNHEVCLEMANSLHQLHSSSLGLPPASYVYSLAPCGDDVLSVISSDNSLRYFDRQTLQLLPDGVFSSIHLRGGDDSGVTCLCPVNSGNQNLLATCGRDGIARLWDLRERRRDAVARFSTGKPKILLRSGYQSVSPTFI